MIYKIKAEEVRNQTRKQKSCFIVSSLFAVVVMALLMIGCAATPPLADVPAPKTGEAQAPDIESIPVDSPDESAGQATSLPENEPVSDPTFETFLDTGLDICTNGEGRPLIYLFTSPTCPHCRWGGGIYDFIVRYYTSNGLIEAHHYDLLSGDDLLTEETESEIPEDKMEIYRNGNPKDLVPYYNFGCKFDRVGNGYEKDDDLAAEGEEMRRVMDFLVKAVSGEE